MYFIRSNHKNYTFSLNQCFSYYYIITVITKRIGTVIYAKIMFKFFLQLLKTIIGKIGQRTIKKPLHYKNDPKKFLMIVVFYLIFKGVIKKIEK